MRRIELSEYGPYYDLHSLAQQTTVPASKFRLLIEKTSARIESALSLGTAFERSDERIRPVGFAGLLRLGPGIELEIRPKFLPESTPNWREDFFTVATIARYGHILPRDALLAGIGEKGDLADLIARTVVHMYNSNRSRPLRLYQHRTWMNTHLDGELDPESLFMPEDDGFAQSGLILDRQNPYNQTTHEAMTILVSEVRNGDLMRQLTAARCHLSPQIAERRFRVRSRLPSRHRRWQDLFDLSLAVTKGFGAKYGGPLAPSMPGYIIKTADAWESLVLTAVRYGLPSFSVTKKIHRLGFRSVAGQTQPIDTTPDITVSRGPEQFLIDAKYKGRHMSGSREHLSIQATDLYEALAFLQAGETKRCFLVYPTVPRVTPFSEPPGSSFVFERNEINGREVFGVAALVSGISRPGGFRTFASNLSDFLLHLAG